MRSKLHSSFATFAALLLAVTLATHLAAQTENSRTQEQKSGTKAKIRLQPLDIKTGLWETTRTSTVSGEIPIPASMLAKMSPEQRARFEERLKANSAENTRTDTDQSCITKEDLEDGDYARSKKECTQTILSSSSTQASGTLACEMEGIKFNGSLEIHTVDREHYKGSVHSTTTGNGQARIIDIAFTSRWLGANCNQ